MIEVKNCKKEKLYSIGEVSKKCNITTRTLRYYEKLNLIKPDYVDYNRYRFYSEDAILKINIIKYLKIIDFSLEEIKDHLQSSDFYGLIDVFEKILSKSDDELDEIRARKVLLKDWKKLLEEASIVINEDNIGINTKYIEEVKLIKYPMTFDFSYRSAILNMDFSQFIERQNNKISGPVYFYYPNIKERMERENKNKSIEIFYTQKALNDINNEHEFILKPALYMSKYHIGRHEDLQESYKALIDFQKSSPYEFVGPVLERFVTDYWSTFDKNKFVTEIIAQVKVKNKEKVILVEEAN